MFNSLLMLVSCSVVISVTASTTCLYLYYHCVKEEKLTKNIKSVSEFLILTLALLITLLAILIPRYNFNQNGGYFGVAETYMSSIEPNFLNVSSDQEICIYLSEKTYFYETLFSISPSIVITLERHDEEQTRTFLENIFVEGLYNFDDRHGERKKIIRFLDTLHNQTEKMAKHADIFPKRNINSRDAIMTIQAVLKDLRNNYNYDDDVVREVIQLEVTYNFPEPPLSFTHYPTVDELNREKKLAWAAITFYDLLLSQGNSKAANAMRYISLQSHFSDNS